MNPTQQRGRPHNKTLEPHLHPQRRGGQQVDDEGAPDDVVHLRETAALHKLDKGIQQLVADAAVGGLCMAANNSRSPSHVCRCPIMRQEAHAELCWRGAGDGARTKVA